MNKAMCVSAVWLRNKQISSKKCHTQKRKLRPFAEGRTQAIRVYTFVCVKKGKKLRAVIMQISPESVARCEANAR